MIFVPQLGRRCAHAITTGFAGLELRASRFTVADFSALTHA
jgi:hypothetical protein